MLWWYSCLSHFVVWAHTRKLFQPRPEICSSGHHLATYHCAISRGFCRAKLPREWEFHLRKAISLPGSLSGTALFSEPAATVTKRGRRAVLAAPQTMMDVSGAWRGNTAVNCITRLSICVVAQGRQKQQQQLMQHQHWCNRAWQIKSLRLQADLGATGVLWTDTCNSHRRVA